ncbi:MAG TPA: DUF805 domain-containing protein [Novosphingobium sp.]|nr:DUF805 domain-containing protein [Novosphingobium sp.]HZV10644.1 DUF805 domain-containing protein [Novosphingobium sp.]
MDWMLLPYRRYFDFSGRSRRREFWLFSLFCMCVNLAIDFGLGGPYATLTGYSAMVGTHPGFLAQGLTGLFGLFSFIPSWAVAVRRLHDIDRSGWWLLLVLLPVLGWFVLLVFNCLDGTAGRNSYGFDPKGRGFDEVFR